MPQDDPRDVTRAVKRTPPPAWAQESAGMLSVLCGQWYISIR